MKVPVPDGVNDPALGEFADSVEYTFDLGSCSEDSDADLVGFTGVAVSQSSVLQRFSGPYTSSKVLIPPGAVITEVGS
jgi:hypothetical protein